MPVGIVIERRGLELVLDVEALSQPSLRDEVVAPVDRLSIARLVHTITVHRLNSLVIVSEDEEAAWQKGQEALRLGKEDPFALRVLNLTDLCGRVHDRAEATWKASLLLRAGAAMVREYPWLHPANIRLRLGGLRARLSRRALLTAPRPRHEVIPAVDEGRCAHSQGCDLCYKACPFDAIRLDGVSVSVDKDRCQDCGLCVSASPTGAAGHPFYRRRVLDAALTALLTDDGQRTHPRIIAFTCRTAMTTLREAGHRRLTYPAAILPLEVPSAGFPDLYLVLRAFGLGALGVAVLSCDGGCSTSCEPESFCARFSAVQQVLASLGLGSERLTLINGGSARRVTSSLATFAERILSLPPHVLSQGLPVPGQAYRYRTGGLLAGMSRRMGIGGALSVEHDGLPFGQSEFEASACSLCGLCSDSCPTGAMKYSEGSESASLEFTARDCTGCRLCSDACPEGALRIVRRLDGLSLAGDPIVLKSAELCRCQQCGQGYAPEALVSRVRSSLGQRASAVDLRYCPDCRMLVAIG